MLKHNLALRLSLFLGLLVMAGLGTLTYHLITTSSRALVERTSEEAMCDVRFVANGIRREMREDAAPTVPDFLSDLIRGTEVERVSLYKPSGELSFSSTPSGPLRPGKNKTICQRCHDASGGAKEPRDGVKFAPGEKGQMLWAFIHLKNTPDCWRCHKRETPILGVVMTEHSLSELAILKYRMGLWTAIAGLATFLLLSLCMGGLVNRFVHRPLKTLGRTMGRLAAGELQARASSTSEDEFGHLAEGFNSMAAALEEKVHSLEALATTDYLTGLANHRDFQENLKSEMSRAERYTRPLSLLMVDIDHFKHINDQHGHQAGDEALRVLAGVIRGDIRDSDLAARYGGEEFAIILPETGGQEARLAAERLRAAVERHSFPVNHIKSVRLTVSVGVAEFPTDSAHAEGLVMAADVALLRAKQISRNRVCAYGALAHLGELRDPYLLHRALEEEAVDSVATLVEELEGRDPYVRGHSRRVSELALQAAEKLGLPQEEKQALLLAALLHDIGKIGIPVAILEKPSGLTEEERQFVQTHPAVGGAILKAVGRLADLVPVILHHHERYDGGGYPDGLKGEAIPLLARILSAADATDAMLSMRPYRAALSVEETIAEVEKNAGAQFDPEVAQALISVLRETGTGTAVNGSASLTTRVPVPEVRALQGQEPN